MNTPTPAELAVLIHFDGGPTPAEQGRRPTSKTTHACLTAGWLEPSAEDHPRHLRTTPEGVNAIRTVIPDYVSPGTAPKPTALAQLRQRHPHLVDLLDAHATGDTDAAERIAAYVLALTTD